MNRSIWTKSSGALPLIIFFWMMGFAAVIYSLKSFDEAMESSEWATTNGDVLVSETFEESDRRGTTYHYRVRYQYNVDGEQRTASRVFADDYGTGNPAHAESVVEEYRVGDSVTVYYEPRSPDNAVLVTGASGGWLIPLGVGILFLLPGSCLLVVYFVKGYDFVVGILSMWD